MRNFAAPILLIFLLLQMIPYSVSAQEENDAIVKQGTRYYSLKIKSLDKYNSRIEQQQKHLLNKLKKKEAHFAHRLKNTDSLAYAKYKQQSSVSYDSISKLSKADTGSTAANFSRQKNKSIDSIKGVANFVQSKSGLAASSPEIQSQNAEMSELKGKLNFRAYITQLITQRTNSLKNLSASDPNIPGPTGIETQVFYGKAKMKAFKDMEEDPTKAEDKAMEYLQGTEGFDKEMNSATGGMGGNLSGDAAQIQRLGYQTKQQIQGNIQKKFGGNISGVAKQLSSGLSDFQNKQNDITGSITDTKKSIQQLRSTGQPTFKVNPMRELPFWKRIEKQYSWQTTRASADGSQPAIIQLSVMLGYKQTQKLLYGCGIATSFGLGQNWNNVRLSFQGIGFRSFLTWEWQYGIGVYSGYERMYNGFLFIQSKGSLVVSDTITNTHNTANYNESLLLGLTKKYEINKKYTGQIQVLYDVWWKEKGLRSPIVLRFATLTK